MELPELPKETVQKSIELGKLILAFGRVERATHHEDGVRKETDTDHTVMLGIMAPAFAQVFVPNLDRGLIAQFALVHDFVEVYATDTPTFRIMSDADKKEKQERENAALVRLKKEFETVFPWITDTIEQYERLDTAEARFVKLFDKVLPKIVHILNDGATARELGHSRASVREFHEDQYKKFEETYGAGQPEVMALMRGVIEYMESEIKYEK